MNEWQVPPTLWEKLRPLAKEMRKKPTRAEYVLWQALRRKQLGAKFRRQHAIERFIVDFYCTRLRLIIEVDGDVHQYTVEQDYIRQAFLEALGYEMLRFSNDAVLNELEGVCTIIREAIEGKQTHV